MVSEEYGYTLNELEARFNLRREDSRFYYPHWKHDNVANGAHANAFEVIIGDLIESEAALAVANQTVNEAAEARTHFFRQFMK